MIAGPFCALPADIACPGSRGITRGGLSAELERLRGQGIRSIIEAT
jgi:hypothetical protein